MENRFDCGPAPSTRHLPEPHRAHATCAWCRLDFGTIADLIDHVDAGHYPIPARAA